MGSLPLGLQKERTYRLQVARCSGAEDESVLWSQTGRKWETPRHQEKMLIIRCTGSGHHHDPLTERCATAALQLPGRLSIHSAVPTPPPLQRSKTAEPADRGQEHLLCTWCLRVPHHLKPLAGKALLFVCVQFRHKALPCDFLESVASRPGDSFPHQNQLHVA